MTAMSHRKLPLLAAVMAILAILLLAPGVDGPFLFDDVANLLLNRHLQPTAWTVDALLRATFSGIASDSGRPLAMATFAINAWHTGMDPMPIKLTNLLIHAFNSILVLALVRRLARLPVVRLNHGAADWLALSVAAAWAFHPIAVTSTLYAIQRMNSLGALFTLSALLLFLAGRKHWESRLPLAWTYFAMAGGCVLLGVLAKENVILAPVFMVLIECIFLKFRRKDGTRDKTLLATAAAGAIAGGIAVLVFWDRLVRGYAFREFSLPERLMTESRVLWDYITMTLLPLPANTGLYLDDKALSTGLMNPASTLLAILGLALLLALAICLRHRNPLVAFGLSFWLAGHLLESTLIPLEIAYEHRQYLPSVGVLIAVMAPLFSRRLDAIPVLRWAILAGFICMLSVLTVFRSLQWKDPFVHAQMEAHFHPESERAQMALAGQYAGFANIMLQRGNSQWTSFYHEAANEHYVLAHKASPNSAEPLLAKLLLNGAIDGTLDENTLYMTADRLAGSHGSASWATWLAELETCMTQLSYCGIQAPHYELLLRSALANPGLAPKVEAEIAFLAARYFVQQRNDLGSAEMLIRRGIELRPGDVRGRLLLTEVLAAAGQKEAALAELQVAEDHDSLGMYNSRIAELRNAILNSTPDNQVEE